jgi:NADPH-dependent curcumin reductase CurA
MITNPHQFVLAKRPEGFPDESAFRAEEFRLPDLSEGDVRVHGLYYSVDPYMRGRMNEGKSYAPPFELGQPIQGAVVGKVVESRSAGFKLGDFVFGILPWATEMVVQGNRLQVIDTDVALATEYLGVLGMTGLTAYFGLLDIGRPQEGDVVVVSGAAGAVGTVVGQIAKIKGCYVVGIVGSEEKGRLLQDHYGFDQTLNYKTAVDLASEVKEACPGGVDIYFDNVGGKISDAVMLSMNVKSRIVLCGQISLYNLKELPQGPRLQPLLLTRSVLMQGFIVSNYQERFPEALKALAGWLRDGKLESSQTILEGFDNLPKALIGLFDGKNVGKMIVKSSA